MEPGAMCIEGLSTITDDGVLTRSLALATLAATPWACGPPVGTCIMALDRRIDAAAPPPEPRGDGHIENEIELASPVGLRAVRLAAAGLH
mmetsp:Transcript_18837/g.41140  ORF Transcript_18837/g.41140 Transcript_18837/m.41140 type:complete len:90 (+) Transcript_18837:228-497(+)